MYSHNDEPRQVGAKSAAAYERAKAACIGAWGQGVRQEPLSGDALWVAELADQAQHLRCNVVREKYKRGLDRLPFED